MSRRLVHLIGFTSVDRDGSRVESERKGNAIVSFAGRQITGAFRAPCSRRDELSGLKAARRFSCGAGR